ncbi:hypothetical protein [Flexithrix dorotheae]|uniref:hypothetical protein n=1 Tax=Flexithrix dorotheae TaxID=70993 RepID=UPI00037EAC5B|nr:hypothetical protein [Flexithrix dorotheae]
MKKYIFYYYIILPALVLFGHFASGQENEKELTWPREISTKVGTITLYQPQLETFEKNILSGRMALSIKPPEEEMMFGAFWFKARLATDIETRTARLEEFTVDQTKFADLDEEEVQRLSEFLKKKFESAELEMSLDRITASLESVAQDKQFADSFQNDPPEIYFRTNATVLIYIDGEPILKNVENSEFDYVVNTPFFLVKDKKDDYYLKGGKFWWTSKEITKGWKETGQVSRDLEKLAKDAIPEDDNVVDSAMLELKEAPEIIVSTVPAELILSDGDPSYAPIQGTSLLYVTNSESDIIMHIDSQEHYILLAGRWYSSKTLQDGDWKFKEPTDLPEEFQKIPVESDIADVRTSVPGTEEAKDAMLGQSIPQTATVDRKTATVEVQYDGNPEFKKIDGTKVSSAVNADKTVLLIEKKYYVVDDGIWFVSDKATGPWEVSVIRPDEVDDIPPSSPAYNVKYVYVYDYTPSVVYVGYLPGYTWSYMYGGVVVYGTGYYYPPWYSTYYYPRPVTYGFSVHYNPWTGWGFSFGFSYGWFSAGWHRPYYGWWGPCGYRYGYRHGYYHGYHHGYRHGYHHGYRAGYRAGQRQAYRNVYRNRNNGVKSTGRVNHTASGNALKARPSQRPNNVYSDRNGNVYQRDNKGNWQPKSNYNRKSTQPSTRPNQGNQNRTKPQTSPSTRPSNPPSNMNRDYNNRYRGTNNYNNYQRQRTVPRSRPSGGGRRRF